MERNKSLFDAIYLKFRQNNQLKNLPDDIELEAICKLFYIMLPEVLSEMTQRQRDVITLYYGHNFNQTQISRKLKINQSNVSNHLRIASDIIYKFFIYIYKCSLWGLRYEKGQN